MQYTEYACKCNRRKHITGACDIIEEQAGILSGHRGKEQGMKHHESELQQKENFDKLI